MLLYASFLLDISLVYADFLHFRTSQVTVCALAIALYREQKLTGASFEKELSYLQEVMRMEEFDTHTFRECKSLFDRYREKATETKNGPKSLIRKYAASGAVIFRADALA